MPADRRLFRRIALLNCHFARNLAYYRAGFASGDGGVRLIDTSEVGVTINSNFLDIAVLEWCKLFVDRKSKHHWRRVIETYSAQTEFHAALLASLELEAGWERYVDSVGTYRDKFVAHLDNEDVANIPSMELALSSCIFLHGRLSATVPAGTLESIYGPDLPRDLAAYYDSCYTDARTGPTPGQAVASPLRPSSRL